MFLSVALGPIYSSRAFSFDWSSTLRFYKLIDLLNEARKRLTELKKLGEATRAHKDLFEKVNRGFDQVVGIIELSPIKDEKILSEIYEFRRALGKIEYIYGQIPKSDLSGIQLLTDQTVAEWTAGIKLESMSS